MNDINQKDKLFLQILYDLAQDIIEDTQSAAEKTIDLSSQFLGEDSQDLVDNFRSFNEASSQHIETDTTQNKDVSHDEQLNVVRLNIAQIASKNKTIRAEVNVVLSSMQFSELLRQHLEGVRTSFEVMINDENKTIEQLKIAMQKTMHTYDERKAFHEHVMHEEMPSEDEEVTQDLIDQLFG